MESKNIVLGADPEVFVAHADGKLFPAFEFLPSKYEPAKTGDDNNVYWDGFQAEFNISASADVAKCLNSIRHGLKAVLLAAKSKDPTATLSFKTVVNVPLETLRALPNELTEFGCMPSYNVYDIRGRGLDGVNVPYRFAGGHIHFGIGRQPDDMIINIVKALDAILGVACVSLFENLDNPVRRQYYGLAGEFRLPPHGLEYRTLSDAWMFSPHVAGTILDLSRKIVAYIMSGGTVPGVTDEEVIETILLSDVDKARGILARTKPLLDKLDFKSSINLMAPIEESVPDIRNIAANWSF